MKKTIAITASDGLLISHEFDSEEEAFKKMPYIKRWSRETWDKRYHCRYHSKSAERYWRSRHFNDKIESLRIVHKGNNKTYLYDW